MSVPALANPPIVELDAALGHGALTSEQLVCDAFLRIEGRNSRLHSFIRVNGGGALTAAR